MAVAQESAMVGTSQFFNRCHVVNWEWHPWNISLDNRINLAGAIVTLFGEIRGFYLTCLTPILSILTKTIGMNDVNVRLSTFVLVYFHRSLPCWGRLPSCPMRRLSWQLPGRTDILCSCCSWPKIDYLWFPLLHYLACDSKGVQTRQPLAVGESSEIEPLGSWSPQHTGGRG